MLGESKSLRGEEAPPQKYMANSLHEFLNKFNSIILTD
jgi:hypothetical protein